MRSGGGLERCADDQPGPRSQTTTRAVQVYDLGLQSLRLGVDYCLAGVLECKDERLQALPSHLEDLVEHEGLGESWKSLDEVGDARSTQAVMASASAAASVESRISATRSAPSSCTVPRRGGPASVSQIAPASTLEPVRSLRTTPAPPRAAIPPPRNPPP